MSHITRFWTRHKHVKGTDKAPNFYEIKSSIVSELSKTSTGGISEISWQAKVLDVKQQTIRKCSELIQTAVDSLTQQINQVKNGLSTLTIPTDDEINAKIHPVQQRLEQLENKPKDETVQKVESIQTKLTELETLCNNLKRQMETNSNDDVSQSIQSIQQKLTELETSYNTFKESEQATTDNSINERLESLQEQITELETTREVTDAARKTSINNLQDQISALVKFTQLNLGSEFNGDLVFISFNRLHFLSGYVGFETKARNPIVCDMPDVVRFLPYIGIGIYVGSNGMNKAVYIRNNQNRLQLVGNFETTDICYFNHLIRVDK